jgi:Tripartite tricarboxylate transporter TctB family
VDGDARRAAADRSDLVTGGVWVVLGVAIMIGSWRMDRLESQGVQWFTAPGLVPGVLGVLITIAAIGIVLRALRHHRPRALGPLATQPLPDEGALVTDEPDANPDFGARAALTLVLCIGFAAGLVGYGIPFWVAAATYLFLHIFLLQLPERRARGEVARAALVAAAIAIGAAATISYIFQEVFLVRLP